MLNFFQKKPSESHNLPPEIDKIYVGKYLASVRESREFTINDIATRLNLKPVYIHGIEKGDWSVAASDTYIKGYITQYADLLAIKNPLHTRHAIPNATLTPEQTAELLIKKNSNERRNRSRKKNITYQKTKSFKLHLIGVITAIMLLYILSIQSINQRYSHTNLSNILPAPSIESYNIGKNEQDYAVKETENCQKKNLISGSYTCNNDEFKIEHLALYYNFFDNKSIFGNVQPTQETLQKKPRKIRKRSAFNKTKRQNTPKPLNRLSLESTIQVLKNKPLNIKVPHTRPKTRGSYWEPKKRRFIGRPNGLE